LFPTTTGSLIAEWSVTPWSMTLEIGADRTSSEWHALNVTTDEEDSRNVDLTTVNDWNWVMDQIRHKGGILNER